MCYIVAPREAWDSQHASAGQRTANPLVRGAQTFVRLFLIQL
jgi:hypothetical protein